MHECGLKTLFLLENTVETLLENTVELLSTETENAFLGHSKHSTLRGLCKN